jgi:ATP-dependent Clp protease protease subunit
MEKYFKPLFVILCLSSLTFFEVAVAESQSTSGDPKTQPTKTETKKTKKEAKTTLSDDPEIAALQKKLEHLKLQHAILSTQNLIQSDKNKKVLLEYQHEKGRLRLMNELQLERERHELAELSREKEKRSLKNALYAAKQKQLLGELNAQKVRLSLEREVYEHEKMKLFAEREKEKQELAMQNALTEELNKKEGLKIQKEGLKIQLETAKLNLEIAKFQLQKNKSVVEVEEMANKISNRMNEEVWESEINKPKAYLKNPFVDDHLIISDRRIDLGIVIVPGVANYVNERIHYYNNKNTEVPIFLVIDFCVGGSVMEGAKIIEAMKSSQAPVYVVVKTLAASMAAVITTLAKHSFAYPNAVIIHHQVWSFAIGNQKEIKEQLEITKEWTRRLLQPVAKKMGITMNEFVEKMYEHNSIGDWYEFADVAVNYKWVDNVVKDIRDVSFSKQPVDMKGDDKEGIFILETKYEEKIDPQGQRFVKLPRLNQLDVYYLYNPKKYYR